MPRIRIVARLGRRDEHEGGGQLDLVGQHRAALGERGVPRQPDGVLVDRAERERPSFCGRPTDRRRGR